MQGRTSSFWRWLALLLTLFLVPALCIAGAFASHLQITSPYFSLSFGPQRAGQPPLIVYNGGPSLPPGGGVLPPIGDPPPTTGGPQDPPGNGSVGTGGNHCLLGLLCLSVDTGLGEAGIVNLDLGKATPTAAPRQGSDNSDLSPNLGVEVPAVGTQLDVGADVDSGNVQLQVDLDLQGGNEQNGDEADGINLNVLDTLQVGVGGGSGGVNIGLNLPSLFP
ncbi:MAG: hypothetical protein KF701_08820 [Anaerolineales bacterium]|nr:MAG: hypothetical protein KF701_08820 [Anaerolineales bacterium]